MKTTKPVKGKKRIGPVPVKKDPPAAVGPDVQVVQPPVEIDEAEVTPEVTTPDLGAVQAVVDEYKKLQVEQQGTAVAGAVTIETQEVDADEPIFDQKKLSRGLARLIVRLTDLAFKRMPNPEPLTDFEKEFWGEDVEECISIYLPLLKKYGPLFVVLTDAVVIFTPRAIPLSKEEKKQDASSDPNPG